ncbi:MAG: sulfatase [Bacteroidales bacterium]|jgi:arylsulfatase A-like enzyme|nr:sulfatase [Bacteroidales bacterium]
MYIDRFIQSFGTAGKRALHLSPLMATGIMAAGCTASEQKDSVPNIIFILSDDHSAPFLSCYGDKNIQTPNIDRLAKEGILFRHAYTTAPQSVPSRAGLMTGRSTVDVRMTRFSAPLSADIVAFPEWLRKAGYHTGICGRNFHLDGARNPPESETVFQEYHLRTFEKRVDYLRQGGSKDALPQLTEFLNTAPKEKPFFIQVGFNEPHRIFDAANFEPDPATLQLPVGMPDIPELRKDLAGYYGEIQRLDGYIGQLLDELDQRGLAENTLVVFIGDNGGALLRGKGTLNDLGIHVPLLARWPKGIPPGQISDALISGEDIAPTFLDVARYPIPEEITGKSFVPAFTDSLFSAHAFVFSERGAHGGGLPQGSAAFDLGRTVFSKEYKLIYNALWQLPYEPVDFSGQPFWKKLKDLHGSGKLDPLYSRLFFAGQRPIFELYDRVNDPYELNNLAGNPDYAEQEHALKAELQKWMILNQDFLPLPVPPGNQNRQNVIRKK